jgi:hypothetical protein
MKIPNFEYDITSNGIITNLIDNKIVKQFIVTNGYYRTILKRDNKYYNLAAHRLVLITFDGDYPDLDVNHKNGIKTDNRIENLEWCTRSENIKHSFDNKLQLPSGRKKVQQLNKNNIVIAEFESASYASRITNVAQASISKCANNKLLSAGGFIWKWL